MRLARDRQRERANARARGCVARQQRRLGLRLLQVLEDRERLWNRELAVDERRHDLLRVQRAIRHAVLLPAIP